MGTAGITSAVQIAAANSFLFMMWSPLVVIVTGHPLDGRIGFPERNDCLTGRSRRGHAMYLFRNKRDEVGSAA